MHAMPSHTPPHHDRVPRTWRPGTLALAAAGALIALISSACDRVHLDARPIPNARQIGGPGQAPGSFVKPRALASDGRTLWVIDRSGRVQRIDPSTGLCLQLFRLPEAQLGFPTGLTIAPSPRGDGAPALWVPDTHYHRVLVYAVPPLPTAVDRAHYQPHEVKVIEPTMLAEFGGYGRQPGQFVYPTSVAVLPATDGRGIERVYVTEYGGNDRVQVFDGALQPLAAFGHFGGGDAPEADSANVDFQRPQTLIIDAAHRRLIVSDSVNHRLGLFDLDGRLQRWIDGRAEPDPARPERVTLRHPRGLHLLPDGTLLVVEFGNNRVQRIDLDAPGGPRTLAVWGKAGRGPGELAEPWAIDVIDGNAYVVDALNHRVVAFTLE